jgi:hypothetical protein
MRSVTRFHWLTPLATLLALALIVLTPGTSSAHERRKIAGEKAEVVVGWIIEPAYVEEPNGIDFRAMRPGTTEPIEGLEKTVKVEITKGGAKKTYDLKTRFGMKGAYTADIIPTSTGDYSFRFTGEIEGTMIDETFESGPGRFNAIQPLTTTQFPAPLASTGELQAQLAAAQATADTARTIAFIGLGVGVLGLLAAGAAFAMRGRSPSNTPSAGARR